MKERETFASRIGFILVSAGCAVGLGNVWKFPYICGENGGALFILLYLVFLAALGIPILVAEFTVGRASKKSVIGAFDALEKKGSKYHLGKYVGLGGNIILMMYYTMVSGWMLYYAYLEITGKMSGLSTEATGAFFSQMLANPGTMIFWAIVAIVVSFFVCSKGLQNGVEKISSSMMILLVILMVIMAIRALTLPGATKGLEFYLVPNIDRFMERGFWNVANAAMTHAFFTLSVGIGSMEIFGSYLKKNNKIASEAISVAVLDTMIALVAGIIIIPSCFAFGIKADAGPSLLFLTLPNVFNQMAGGRIWGAAFFIFMSFASLSTIIAVFENILSMTSELWGWSRVKGVLINGVGISVLAIPAILGFNVLADVNPFSGTSNIMDFEDFIVTYNLLPLGCLLFVRFISSRYGWGWENFLQEANTGKGMSFPKWMRLYMSKVLPLIISIIYLKGYFDFFKNLGTGYFIGYMSFGILLLGFVWSIGLIHKKTQAA